MRNNPNQSLLDYIQVPLRLGDVIHLGNRIGRLKLELQFPNQRLGDVYIDLLLVLIIEDWALAKFMFRRKTYAKASIRCSVKSPAPSMRYDLSARR
jgi:hypothetical protein